MQVRQRRLDQKQMYLVLDQSVRSMRYLRVCRKDREGSVGASFCRMGSTRLLWIRAWVVYCRPEVERLRWLMGERRVYRTMVRRRGRNDSSTSAAEWHAESCRKLPAGGPRQA